MILIIMNYIIRYYFWIDSSMQNIFPNVSKFKKAIYRLQKRDLKKKLKVPTSVPKRFEGRISTQSKLRYDVKDVFKKKKERKKKDRECKNAGSFCFHSHFWSLSSEALEFVVFPTHRTDTPSRAA